MQKKAAVVIGVNRTGGLEPLNAAARAATDVATWLGREGFDVELLTDDAAPVHSSAVIDAVQKFVRVPPQYQLLLVYFSGHGYWHARADRWLLSGAPVDGRDAVNLSGAIDLARYSGIETVVFFSDACRSIPTTAQGQRVEGVDAFPNLDAFSQPNKVDYFKATGEARAAFEIRPRSSTGEAPWVSVLTTAWLKAYEQATPEMVINVDVDGKTLPVVPNRKLETYLQPRVDEYLAGVDPTLVQILDINVPSADNVYLGKAHVPTRKPKEGRRRKSGRPPSPPLSLPPPTSNSGDRSGSEPAIMPDILDRLAYPGSPPTGAAPSDFIDRPQFQALIPPSKVDHFESRCGLTLTGGALVRVATTAGLGGGAQAELLDQGDPTSGSPAVARLWGVSPATSLIGQLTDGRCFVIPAFDGYIGHVTVGKSGVSNVSYVPSSGTERFQSYRDRKSEIDEFRALVAAAVDQDTFVVRDVSRARQIADMIRMEKRLDPSLGLYAAHAYSSAGLDKEVVDVLNYMNSDLNAALFDVAMLASRTSGRPADVVPFCPILTQTWNLLRPRGWTVPAVLEEARPALLGSLWTTFDQSVADVIFDAVARQDLV